MNKNKEESLKKRIVFPKGLPGLEEYREFLLTEEEGTLLAQMEAADNNEIGFVLVRPHFVAGYLPEVELGQQEAEILEAKPEDEMAVWSIVTLCQSDVLKSTVNLRAPLLVNNRTRKGYQLILDKEEFSFRQPLFPEPAGEEVEAVQEGVGG